MSVSYLSCPGVFTQKSFIVDGKDRGIIIYVQHRDESDAFPNLDRILWKIKGEKEDMSKQTLF